MELYGNPCLPLPFLREGNEFSTKERRKGWVLPITLPLRYNNHYKSTSNTFWKKVQFLVFIGFFRLNKLRIINNFTLLYSDY